MAVEGWGGSWWADVYQRWCCSSGVSSWGDARPRPHLSLLQRRGPSPGLEWLLLGVSASHEKRFTWIAETNKTHVNTEGHPAGSTTLPPLLCRLRVCSRWRKKKNRETDGPTFIHWGPLCSHRRKGALVLEQNAHRLQDRAHPPASADKPRALTLEPVDELPEFFCNFAILSVGLFSHTHIHTDAHTVMASYKADKIHFSCME